MKYLISGAACVAAVLAFFFSFLPIDIVGAQQPACLHGPKETPVDKDRRERAIVVTRQVNTAAAAEAAKSGGKYHPLVHLIERKTISGPPVGFQMRITTDGAEYMFSMKDTLDPCQFALFSDEKGLVYQAEALR